MRNLMLAGMVIILGIVLGARAGELDDTVKDLARKLGGEDLYARGEAAGKLEKMCNDAARPGAEEERVAVCRAMAGAVGEDVPKMGRVWLLRQIEKVGKAEVVDALAGLLEDKDALIRQQALIALAANPSDEAAAKLRGALEKADDSYARVAIINALGFRRDAKAVGMLAKWTEDNDARVAGAAINALATIGNAEALDALSNLKVEDLAVPREVVIDAAMRAIKAAGNANGEKVILAYEAAYHTPPSAQMKLAGLRGLALGPSKQKAFEVLLAAIKDADAKVRLTAAELAGRVDAEVAEKLLGEFDALPPASQAALLSGLAERGGVNVKEKAQRAIGSKDSEVRLAGIAALGATGDAATAVQLAKMASDKKGAEQNAARESLARIRGNDVDDSLMAALPSANEKIRAELVRGLAARRAMGAIPTLEKLAKDDPDSAVRIEAINGIGAIASPKSLSTLLDIVLNCKEEKQISAAESAAGAVLGRIDNADERSRPLLAMIEKTSGQQRMAVLRLLGRTGSRDALEALRNELKTGSPDMHNATVRALAEWPDARVTGDLIAIARDEKDQTNKVLALRGYVRVVALPSDRRPYDTAKMLGEALKLAPTNEKKAVLGALGAVVDPEALKLASPMMEDQAVRNEAITATLRIARAIAGTSPDEASAAAQRAQQLSDDVAVKRNVAAILQAADRAKDFVTDWAVSGPYMEDGKDKSALFDIAFAPEKGEQAKWMKMPPSPDKSRFWELNLDAVEALRGNDRAAYLRTSISVPKAQELQLEVGSDDAIKVWVNGELVHANNASRGNEPGQDKVKVKLNEGSNVILLKVVNGGGGWGANARLRTLDDKKVEGMRVRGE